MDRRVFGCSKKNSISNKKFKTRNSEGQQSICGPYNNRFLKLSVQNKHLTQKGSCN